MTLSPLRNQLVAEIVWRCKQRGTKELTIQLTNFFAEEIETNFDGWQEDQLRRLINFLKQDEEDLLDFFIATPTKQTLHNMLHRYKP